MTEDQDSAQRTNLQALADMVLPGGAVPIAGVVTMLYLDEQGDEAWCFGVVGRTSFTNLVGMLELTESSLIQHQLRGSE